MRETNHHDVSIRKTITYMEEHPDETLEIETLTQQTLTPFVMTCRQLQMKKK